MTWFRTRSPIGIDLGTRFVKAVQLEKTRTQGIRLASALVMPRRASDADTLVQLDDALSRLGFTGRQVAVACPTEVLRSEVFELPSAAPGVPVTQIAEAEMRRLARIETSAFEMAYWPLPASARASSGATSVMAVAAMDADTDALADRFDAVGLNVIAIDTQACALARAAASLSRESLLVIAELGAAAATIALAHDGRVVYQRAVADAGLNALRSTLCDDLRLDEDEADCVLSQTDMGNGDAPLPTKYARLRALVAQHAETIAREIDSSVAFAAHRYPSLRITGVSLAGGGARLQCLTRDLAARLRHPVAPLTPAMVGFTHPHLNDETHNPQLLAALGLALNKAG